MNLVTVSKAILARIKADTGTGGLYSASAGTDWSTITGAWANEGSPANPNRPYIVWSLAAEAQDTMPGDGGEYTLEFTIHDDKARGFDRVDTVFNRLIGDAMLSTGTRAVPTYGFQRHLLVLAANTLNLVGGEMSLLGSTLGPGETMEQIVGTLSFRGLFSVLAANP